MTTVTDKKSKNWRILDSFAGAGGFSLGFQNAGCDVVGAIEIDEWASETFLFNHPHAKVIRNDIQKIDDSEIVSSLENKKPDIILGGPPCQGFSICNKNAGDPTDPRNSLFREFIRLGKLFEPKIMIMENVPNLLNAHTKAGKPVIQIIENELKELGYNVYSSVLDAINYGIPQIRRRLFVIASKRKLENPFPKPTHKLNGNSAPISLFDEELQECPKLWDAISDLPEIDAREGAEEMTYDKHPENNYQRCLRNGSKALHNHVAMRHSERMVQRFASMAWGDSVADVPGHLKPLRRNGNGEISDKVYDQNNRRMHPNKPCHTIPASFYANFVHPFKNRNFTAREGARIQSFPDSYVFYGKPTVVSHKLLQREGRLFEKHLCQYSQIGNAVPPFLSEAVARNILLQYDKAGE
jgi:DNA (cytosine-5)-methyltransferase 1